MQFIIEEAEYGSSNFDELIELWSNTFGDTPEFAEEFYDLFDDEITGYVALDESGRACSALTLYKAGTFEGVPVYVSYAVCTRPDSRGNGMASALIEHARDEVLARGGISIVSPAEESLEAMYSKLGYKPVFFAAPRAVIAESFEDELEEFEFDEEDDFEIVRLKADVKKIDAAMYNRYREAYLAELPHIAVTEEMLYAAEFSGEGFYAINNGDAICCIEGSERGQLMLSELILSPMLAELSSEIDTEIAQLLASHFGAAEVIYNTPGAGRCQSMAAGMPGEDIANAGDGYQFPPYFGFPIE